MRATLARPGEPAAVPRGVSPLAIALALHALTLVGLFVWSLVRRHRLPERLPIHFLSDGTPNGWAETSWLTALAMPLTAVGIFVLIALGGLAIMRSARRHPRYLNLPRKAELLALPPGRQEPVWRQLEALPAWLALPPQGLICWAQATIYKAAIEGGPGYEVPPVWLFLAVEGGVLVVAGLCLMRAMRRALARAPGEG
ncbi:MAG TPA: DUF1648 domain-containing protein [Myxococcota bacterium]|nr:DUF1648 domain-containing protein [Myxococcota bacterium]HRY93091.1 DUF1648 domain-containing protein [Myxococcota bacterium]HSA20096.1 DUF1648 domain-containing protein [Myxococcota bacterium]